MGGVDLVKINTNSAKLGLGLALAIDEFSWGEEKKTIQIFI